MKFIRVELETETRARVAFIHNFPEMLPDYEKANGFIIDNFPDPEVIEGKMSIPYFNPVTKEIFYEYIDLPKTPEQIAGEHAERIDDLEAAMLEQLLGVTK